ncbi:Sensory transduction protein LytR [Dyadobacter sp. CECT 9275]|uniref:Sensory transduction protein LytR n=1 Tax=Dyadobacter helix TaxID=2822344 RepID=A0A916NBT2_9BACT|nr:LytTR family DNA-binding domain-containing protein [Dyadobacter sp. CECT 9275]CAG4999985.1 Sensory transduction protein LytR [Dyadobacter sp. CECT 9275]
MKNISCLIVDDEVLARRLLADYVNKIPSLHLAGTCASALEAQVVLQQRQVDLLFLDIQMPDLTGISFLQSLSSRPVTIFTTAYTEYAIKGFELSVLDYLVKPISFERFFQAVSKAAEYISYTSTARKDTESSEPQLQEKSLETNYLFVKADYKIHKIHYMEIDYIEAYGEYIRIHTDRGKILTLVALGKMEETLPRSQFIRVHRSYIINFAKIDTIQGNMIFVKGNEVPLSKSYREEFMRLINKDELF